MINQKARGYIYFEDSKYEEVIRVFKNFKFDQTNFLFFKGLKSNDRIINKPGVFFQGEINQEYTKINLIELFRKLMGLNKELVDFNVSLEFEDIITIIKEGGEAKNYINIKVCNNKDISCYHDLAHQVAEQSKAENIVLRTESIMGNIQDINIDIFFKNKDEVESEIEKIKQTIIKNEFKILQLEQIEFEEVV